MYYIAIIYKTEKLFYLQKLFASLLEVFTERSIIC